MKYEKVLTNSKMRISLGHQGEAGRRKVRTGNRKFTLPLRTLINYSKAATVQTSGSGHEDPGLSASNPTSTYDKASWRAQAVTRVHNQVMWFRHAGTDNDK